MADVSLYVHIPFCKSKCAYCDFFSVEKNEIENLYIEKLIAEAERRAVQFDVSEWKTIYIGGGTPSLLKENQIELLFSGLNKICPVAENAEITFECNPDDITKELLNQLKNCGVNRLSVGIQSMADVPLKIVNRRAGRKENLEAIELINKFWLGKNELTAKKNRFSVDLICGLPNQTCESFFKDIDEIIKSGVDHISLYSLILEENTPLYNYVKMGKINLPDDDEASLWWINARNILEKNGFEQYEVSNFAKKHCKSEHNLTYWRMQPYVGIGAGATGTVNDFRYTNSNSIQEWLYDNLEECETLSISTQKFEYLMMCFRTLEGVDVFEFEKRFGESINVIEPLFSKWLKKGLAVKSKKNYALNKKGLLFLNRFLDELLNIIE
jgi:oxygen-independent coproporphyrinogen-3 oxidase